MNMACSIPPLCALINIALALKKDGDQAIGRSKRGLSTKIHTSCDALGNPTGFYLTGGEAHDLQGADVLLQDWEAEALLADKAYDAKERERDIWLRSNVRQ